MRLKNGKTVKEGDILFQSNLGYFIRIDKLDFSWADVTEMDLGEDEELHEIAKYRLTRSDIQNSFE